MRPPRSPKEELAWLFPFLRAAYSLNLAGEDFLMMKPSTDGQLIAKQPETRPFHGSEKPGNASTRSLIDPHCEGDGAILLEFGKAEATVETPGAFIVWVDPEMHGSDPVVSKRLKLRGDHPAPPTACLKSGKDVDMEMRGILVLKPSRSAARILNSFHHVGVARTGGCQSRNLLADERPPVCLQVSVEPAGVRHPYDIADRPAS